jgi:hypothetical protein
MAAGHLWQAAGRRTIPLALPLFLRFYLSGARAPALPFALASQPRARSTALTQRRCPCLPERRPELAVVAELRRLLLRLCVVSVTFSPFLDLHAHRSTGARTPARPVPPPFGVGRRDCRDYRLFGLDTCAFAPATCRDRPRAI